ncbi:diguanylate cyclase [uncultured Gammaproteobacteria bacterium]
MPESSLACTRLIANGGCPSASLTSLFGSLPSFWFQLMSGFSSSATHPVTALEEADLYRDFFENAVVGIYQTTINGHYLRANRALAQIYGYASPAELIEMLTDIAGQLYVDPVCREQFSRLMAEHGAVTDFEAEIFRRDRSTIWIRENARCVRGDDGTILHYEGTVTDITERKLAEENVRLLATAFNSVAEGILIFDRELVVRSANPASGVILGCQPAELIGQPLVLETAAEIPDDFLREARDQALADGHWQGERTLLRRTGEAFPSALSLTSAGHSQYGHAEYFVLVCTDISQRRRIEERIRYQANYDALTTLPNRWLLRSRLEQAIERARETGSRVAVCFLDLDRFKPINDSMGHRAGDELLRLAARRLRNCVRLMDTVGRLGGDEFLVVATDIAERSAATFVAEKIRYSFSEPFELQGKEIFCTASIGIATYPDDGDNVDTLIRNADQAMYHAKRGQRNHYCLFRHDMRQESDVSLDLESDMRRALQRKEYILHYQPKMELDSGRVTGVEALIRWRHPVMGMIPPGEFIPLAEETGVIAAIGQWTLQEACTSMRAWREAGLELGSVAVNLSPRQFNDAKIAEVVRQVLEETGLEPSCLELELTESAIMVDIERAVATLKSLKAVGVRLAIDDFGTGYSSLSYLKRFPIDTLKIDRSFVSDLEHGHKDQAIVHTIIELGKSLGFTVVAEGVESEAQLEFLRRHGCGVVQGYLVSRPLSGDILVEFLNG